MTSLGQVWSGYTFGFDLRCSEQRRLMLGVLHKLTSIPAFKSWPCSSILRLVRPKQGCPSTLNSLIYLKNGALKIRPKCYSYCMIPYGDGPRSHFKTLQTPGPFTMVGKDTSTSGTHAALNWCQRFLMQATPRAEGDFERRSWVFVPFSSETWGV